MFLCLGKVLNTKMTWVVCWSESNVNFNVQTIIYNLNMISTPKKLQTLFFEILISALKLCCKLKKSPLILYINGFHNTNLQTLSTTPSCPCKQKVLWTKIDQQLWQQTLLLFEKCYWLKALCALQIDIDPCNWPTIVTTNIVAFWEVLSTKSSLCIANWHWPMQLTSLHVKTHAWK